MLALDRSGTLALLFAVGALTACPFADDADTDPSAPSDTDTDTDTDTDADLDTGLAYLTINGAITTTDGAFDAGTLGFGAYGVIEQDHVCSIIGSLGYEGPAADAASCPGCVWTFDLGPITGSVTEGTGCDALLDRGVFADGTIDTYWDWSWGFASSYTYYDAEGNPYDLQETLFVDDGSGVGWGFFMFNWADGPVRQITGDAAALTFGRGLYDATGIPAYYYYYYR